MIERIDMSVAPDISTEIDGYKVLVHKDKRAGDYIAVVPEMPVISAFGDTQEDALREIKIVMDIWREVMREKGGDK